MEQLFLDVWSRQFGKSAGGKCNAQTAELFQAYVRVPASAPQHLFQIQYPGFYVEPRASDASGPHPQWAVVWIPGADYAQAQHALRTCEKAVGIARLGSRYGVRTAEAHEQQVFNAIRPTHTFLKVRVVMRFRVHPLPFGFQRASVVQLLKSWGWAAKPLNPTGAMAAAPPGLWARRKIRRPCMAMILGLVPALRRM